MPTLACARCGAALTTACDCPPETRRDARWALADEVIILRHPHRSAAPAPRTDAEPETSS